MRIDTSKFQSTKAVHEFIHKKQSQIIAMKKAEKKCADEIGCFMSVPHELSDTIKANRAIENPPDVLKVRVVINTTYIYDSHEDVHIGGIWKKSLKENRFITHQREHKSGFENIISDGEDLKAYTSDLSFKELGFNYSGNTQALIFESNIRKERNEFMHNYYAKGWVKNHSVGMYYVNILPAIDSKDYPQEFRTWKKYYDLIGNNADIKSGYFFAVTEAKAIEGSAVTRGSNHVTPTLDNNGEPNKFHSQLHNEPSSDTRKKSTIYLF